VQSVLNRLGLEISQDERPRVAERQREVSDPLELPGLGGRVINLEHPKGAKQVRAPPRERVKPRPQDDVLGEGASSQPSSAYRLRVQTAALASRTTWPSNSETSLSRSSCHAGPTSTKANASSSTRSYPASWLFCALEPAHGRAEARANIQRSARSYDTRLRADRHLP
jgi:hypothetical protein